MANLHLAANISDNVSSTVKISADKHIVDLLGAVGELITNREHVAAQQHFLDGVCKVVGGNAVWWSVFDHQPSGTTVESSTVHGLDDAQVKVWNSSFLEPGEFHDHPMWAGLFAEPGKHRTFRRTDLVVDKTWHRHPNIELRTMMGVDDTMGGVVPLSSSREGLLAVTRPLHDRAFSATDCSNLHRLQRASAWIHDQLSRHARGQRDVRLPQRHQRVLDGLLSGASERNIATALGLSPRTIHKYVEQVYRAFEVSSRAELMARWLER